VWLSAAVYMVCVGKGVCCRVSCVIFFAGRCLVGAAVLCICAVCSLGGSQGTRGVLSQACWGAGHDKHPVRSCLERFFVPEEAPGVINSMCPARVCLHITRVVDAAAVVARLLLDM
jgi:hypothetical protein